MVAKLWDSRPPLYSLDGRARDLEETIEPNLTIKKLAETVVIHSIPFLIHNPWRTWRFSSLSVSITIGSDGRAYWVHHEVSQSLKSAKSGRANHILDANHHPSSLAVYTVTHSRSVHILIFLPTKLPGSAAIFPFQTKEKAELAARQRGRSEKRCGVQVWRRSVTLDAEDNDWYWVMEKKRNWGQQVHDGRLCAKVNWLEHGPNLMSSSCFASARKQVPGASSTEFCSRIK